MKSVLKLMLPLTLLSSALCNADFDKKDQGFSYSPPSASAQDKKNTVTIDFSRFITLEILENRIACLETTGERLGIQQGGVEPIPHEIIQIDAIKVFIGGQYQTAFLTTTRDGNQFISYELKYHQYGYVSHKG